MNFATLNQLVESPTASADLRHMAASLLEAIHDWPERDLQEPDELLAALRKQISVPFSYAQLLSFTERLQPATDAWMAESMTSLLAFLRCAISKGLPETAVLEDALALLDAACQRQHWGQV